MSNRSAAQRRIAVVGAGSAQFLLELADLATLPDIGPYELGLCDTDPHRLEVVAGACRRIAAELAVPVAVRTSTDRRDVLDGALAVVVSVGVGGQDAIEPDFVIPARYGLRQTVADTMGVGAVIRILRTAPVLAGIARDMVEQCPDGLLLNVTNPMAMCVMATRRLVPDIETIGLCHSTWQTADKVADLLGIARHELDWAGAGVNHQVFLSRLEHEGVDVYPRLRALAEPGGPLAGTVRGDLLARLGHFVTESSHHNAEYTSWYLPWDEQLAAFGLEANPFERRKAENVALFALAQAYAAGGDVDLASLLPSGEYAPQIIRSLATGEERSIYANLPNLRADGSLLVPQLQAGGVVEVPATCDGAGVHPKPTEPIPPPCAALNRHYLDVCELAVQAVVEGRRDHVHHAALLDPNASATMAPDRIAAMVDELLDVHQASGRLPESLHR